MGIDPATVAGRMSAALRALAPDPVNPTPIIRTALPFYGVGLGDMKRLADTWVREHRDAEPAEVLALADALWETARDVATRAMRIIRAVRSFTLRSPSFPEQGPGTALPRKDLEESGLATWT